jgi:hypothetical protein
VSNGQDDIDFEITRQLLKYGFTAQQAMVFFVHAARAGHLSAVPLRSDSGDLPGCDQPCAGTLYAAAPKLTQVVTQKNAHVGFAVTMASVLPSGLSCDFTASSAARFVGELHTGCRRRTPWCARSPA